jgi:hypothetical protein
MKIYNKRIVIAKRGARPRAAPGHLQKIGALAAPQAFPWHEWYLVGKAAHRGGSQDTHPICFSATGYGGHPLTSGGVGDDGVKRVGIAPC